MRAKSTRGVRFRGQPHERWRGHIDRTPACWEWTGRKLPKGYGYFVVDGRRIYAHRYAWQLAEGYLPDGLVVGHTCDNPSCVHNEGAGLYYVRGVAYPRRGHLWLGTYLANMQDMWDKERGWRGSLGAPLGERNGAAKLTWDQVLEIRAQWLTGRLLQRELAVAYGVSQGQISQIVRGASRIHG